MRRVRAWARIALVVAASFAGGAAGSWILRPEAPAAGPIDAGSGGGIVGTFGVGGVIGSDGTLWQYRPDKRRWLPLDESYALEGQGTSVVPLPVPVGDIGHMETFGFLVTRGNVCWLYDFEKRRWDRIGAPPLKQAK
jgi:hypothetical protein